MKQVDRMRPDPKLLVLCAVLLALAITTLLRVLPTGTAAPELRVVEVLHRLRLAEANGYRNCRDAMRALDVGQPVEQARRIVLNAAAAIPPGDTSLAEGLRREAEKPDYWNFHCRRYAPTELDEISEGEDQNELPPIDRLAMLWAREILADGFDYLMVRVILADGRISEIEAYWCEQGHSDTAGCSPHRP